MKIVYKKILSLILLTVMLITYCVPVRAYNDFNVDNDDLYDVGSRIEAFVDEHKDTMAGLAVSVMNSKNIIYTGYFGKADIENNIPVDDETVMEWGSISKLQVWVCVMQLKEKGLINLDTDIRTYLPNGFLTKLRFDKPITMLNLMNHQAGFDEVPFIWTGSTDHLMSLEEWLKRTEPVQQYEPGTVTSYSNWGSALAAYIVSCISGQTYEEYVKEHIYVPLGMEHASIMPNASDNEWVLKKRNELKTYNINLSGNPLSYGDYYTNCYPAGACMSTMADMQKFAMALMNEDSPLFENPDTLRELLSPSNYYDDTYIGSNYHGFWFNVYYKGTVVGHLGGTAGCSSALWIDIENKKCIAIMTNQHEETQFTDGLTDLIFERYEGELPEFSGIVQGAQAVYNGPLKLQRFFVIQPLTIDSSDKGHTRISLTNENGINRFECGSSDLLVKNLSDILPDIISIAIYALSLLMAIIMLTIGIIQALRHRKSKNSVWCILSAGIQLIPVLVLLRVVMQLMFEQPPFLSIDTIRLMFFVIFAVLIANIAFVIHGVRNFAQREVSKLRMVLTFIILAFSTYGILYWELFKFWRI
jgi:Beta-lactamase class C and other penicillin binding proteins